MLIKALQNSMYFIAKYIIIYVLLCIIYQYYLNYFNVNLKTYDPFTYFITKQSVCILNALNVKTRISRYPYEKIWLTTIINNKITSIINEGCNSISIMISFISFIITLKLSLQSLLFIIISLPMIISINILRISCISYIYIYNYSYLNIIHNTIFPIITYGIILLLSLIWVNILHKNEKNN